MLHHLSYRPSPCPYLQYSCTTSIQMYNISTAEVPKAVVECQTPEKHLIVYMNIQLFYILMYVIREKHIKLLHASISIHVITQLSGRQ